MDLKSASDAYNQALGDQVMIYLCKAITDFDDYFGIKYAFGGLDTTPILTVDIPIRNWFAKIMLRLFSKTNYSVLQI